MSYVLRWSSNQNGKSDIVVPVARVVPGKASITFTGKGMSNYGSIQQENLIHMLENFANTTPPVAPTVGQIWYKINNDNDGIRSSVNVCVNSGTGPIQTEGEWKSLGWSSTTNSLSYSPEKPMVGDEWIAKINAATMYIFKYTGLGRHPEKNGKIGGWEQVFPIPMVVAGREEYDQIYTMVQKLIGPTSDGGNGMIGRYITNLTDLSALDTSLKAAYNAFPQGDHNIVTPDSEKSNLKVDVTSRDWDTLLAAAKVAVNRLAAGHNIAANISSMPFVYDGFKVDSSILTLPTTDVRYPAQERRINKKYGVAALSLLYNETYNTLMNAIQNRYSIRGVNGAVDKYNPSQGEFDASVTTTNMFNIAGSTTSGTQADIKFRLNFNSQDDRERWLTSGGILDVKCSFSTASDNAGLQNLTTKGGLIRITKDKTRFLTNAAPITLNTVVASGFDSSVSGGANVASLTLGPSTLRVNINTISTTVYEITISVIATGYNGSLNIVATTITDELKYGSNQLVFAKPKAFVAADMISKPSFLV